MAASSRILLSYNLKRCIYTTTRNSAKYASREGRFMGKMLGSDGGRSFSIPRQDAIIDGGFVRLASNNYGCYKGNVEKHYPKNCANLNSHSWLVIEFLSLNSGEEATIEETFCFNPHNSIFDCRKWYENKQRPSGAVAAEKLTSNHVTRRMTVLNKLFMQHITELMASGEVSSDLLGRSIEVSHVKVTPDFMQVLVFWFSKREETHAETVKLLHDCAYRLRHELTQLRVIGRVPVIKFVQNKHLAALEELEKRLKHADYGDDHQPILPGIVLKEELMLSTKLSPEVRQQILELDAVKDPEDEEDDEDAFSDLPLMRHDVLGLDHHAIMSRVKHSLSKSQDAAKNRLSNVVTFTSTGINAAVFDPVAFESAKNDSKAFANFLAKRRMEERQKVRRERRVNLRENEENDYYEDDVDEYAKDDRDVDDLEDISLESIRGME